MNKKERLSKGLLKIGELAIKSGLTNGTIRHYANLELIKPDSTTPGDFRLFSEQQALERINYIRKLINQGKSLDEIKRMNIEKPCSKSVLIVDDDREVSDLIKDVLKGKIDADIVVAYDGFVAGKLLGEMIPDLLILDLHLPGVDGFKVCESARQDLRLKHIKILAITGYDSDELSQKITACGADEYLTKPFNIQELFGVISRLLHLS
jgi:two-component system, OmpR family, response regulator